MGKPSIFNQDATRDDLIELRARANAVFLQTSPVYLERKEILDRYIQALDEKIDPEDSRLKSAAMKTFRHASAPHLGVGELLKNLLNRLVGSQESHPDADARFQHTLAESLVHDSWDNE